MLSCEWYRWFALVTAATLRICVFLRIIWKCNRTIICVEKFSTMNFQYFHSLIYPSSLLNQRFWNFIFKTASRTLCNGICIWHPLIFPSKRHLLWSGKEVKQFFKRSIESFMELKTPDTDPDRNNCKHYDIALNIISLSLW